MGVVGEMVNFWCSKIDFKIIEGFFNWWDGGETMGWWWCVGGVVGEMVNFWCVQKSTFG